MSASRMNQTLVRLNKDTQRTRKLERALTLRLALKLQTGRGLQLGIATNCLAGWLLRPTPTISSDCKILHCEQGKDSKWTESLPIKASVSEWGQASWLSETAYGTEIGSFKPGEQTRGLEVTKYPISKESR